MMYGSREYSGRKGSSSHEVGQFDGAEQQLDRGNQKSR
jgi:hypothetical protein